MPIDRYKFPFFIAHYQIEMRCKEEKPVTQNASERQTHISGFMWFTCGVTVFA